jgi:sporulation protein YlmC with PRC-barrel domain
MDVSTVRGKEVFLPDGRRLGTVHDAVIDVDGFACSHLFVVGTPHHLVEQGIDVAVPWRWVRGVGDAVILRWFPETPIPLPGRG